MLQQVQLLLVSSATSAFQLLQYNPNKMVRYGQEYCQKVELANMPNNVPQELVMITNEPATEPAAEGTTKPVTEPRQPDH